MTDADLNDESIGSFLNEMYSVKSPDWEFSHWELVPCPTGGTMWAAKDTDGRSRMFCGDQLKRKLEADYAL